MRSKEFESKLGAFAPFGHRLVGLRLEELPERIGVFKAAEVRYYTCRLMMFLKAV